MGRRLVILAALAVLMSCANDPEIANESTSSPTRTTDRPATSQPTSPSTTARTDAGDHDGMPGPPSDAIAARVVHVTDGDTVVLDGIDIGEVHSATGGRSSRLIGIDTPEVYGGVECYGRQASAFTEREIGGADVLVDFDIETTDRYDRALVYLWTTDGVFFNGRLAQQGYALQSTFPPNVRYVDVFGSLVRDAREHNRGLWSACEEENAAQAPAAQAPAAPAPAAPNPGNCDPAYPDFCIPPPPPDLNCADVDGRRFTVHPPDPHNFDGEGDGLGCES